jgi:hypothetical protein
MPHDYNEDNGNDNDAYDEAPTSTRDWWWCRFMAVWLLNGYMCIIII